MLHCSPRAIDALACVLTTASAGQPIARGHKFNMDFRGKSSRHMQEKARLGYVVFQTEEGLSWYLAHIDSQVQMDVRNGFFMPQPVDENGYSYTELVKGM
jgi:hypothetical protein